MKALYLFLFISVFLSVPPLPKQTLMMDERVLHHTQNVHFRGQASVPRRLYSPFFSQRADLLCIPIDFHLLYLSSLFRIDTSLNVSWRHVKCAIHWMSRHLISTWNNCSSAKTLIYTIDTHAYALPPSPMICNSLTKEDALNLISSYNKYTHTSCKISEAVIFLHNKMSHLSPLYFFSHTASGKGGAHCKSIAFEIKTWWRVSEQCMCESDGVQCICLRERKRDRGGD